MLLLLMQLGKLNFVDKYLKIIQMKNENPSFACLHMLPLCARKSPSTWIHDALIRGLRKTTVSSLFCCKKLLNVCDEENFFSVLCWTEFQQGNIEKDEEF